MEFIYFTEEQIPVMVRAKRKPSAKNIPKRCGTWVISELFENTGWCAVGEIKWSRLKELTYIGRYKNPIK